MCIRDSINAEYMGLDSSTGKVFIAIQTKQSLLTTSFDPQEPVAAAYPQTSFKIVDVKLYPVVSPDPTVVCQFAIATERQNHYIFTLKNSDNAKIVVSLTTLAMRYSLGEAIALLPGSHDASVSLGVVYRSVLNDPENSRYTYVAYRKGTWKDKTGLYAVGEQEIYAGNNGLLPTFVSGLIYAPSEKSETLAIIGADKADSTSFFEMIVNLTSKYRMELGHPKNSTVHLSAGNRVQFANLNVFYVAPAGLSVTPQPQNPTPNPNPNANPNPNSNTNPGSNQQKPGENGVQSPGTPQNTTTQPASTNNKRGFPVGYLIGIVLVVLFLIICVAGFVLRKKPESTVPGVEMQGRVQTLASFYQISYTFIDFVF
eukprot:TRINITY_DN3465_c0_g1_i3.p1 TRINITY_DN3465_c0_g1~~TRINITY_DN3465_c0_g1_i3.p1  ORF type:complete len:370 (+),score=80.14 TRINITY_DN3465_c0_g1_i3:67-1176(+)